MTSSSASGPFHLSILVTSPPDGSHEALCRPGCTQGLPRRGPGGQEGHSYHGQEGVAEAPPAHKKFSSMQRQAGMRTGARVLRPIAPLALPAGPPPPPVAAAASCLAGRPPAGTPGCGEHTVEQLVAGPGWLPQMVSYELGRLVWWALACLAWLSSTAQRSSAAESAQPSAPRLTATVVPSQQQALVPWTQPWGTVGDPPVPDRVLIRNAVKLRRLRARIHGPDRVGGHRWWWAASGSGVAAELLRQLRTEGFTYLDGWQGCGAADELLAHLTELHGRGELKGGRVAGAAPPPAQRGSNANATKNGKGGARLSLLRGDMVGWRRVPGGACEQRQPDVDHRGSSSSTAVVVRSVCLLDGLVALLREASVVAAEVLAAAPYARAGLLENTTLRSDAMLTVYPGNGARYVRHTDNSCKRGIGQRCNGRRLTAIAYLNPHSLPPETESLDGALRLYGSEEGGAAALMGPPRLDIAPVHDRLVLFWADSRVPHEVLPTSNPRYALTVWCESHPPRRAGRHTTALCIYWSDRSS
jgi:hypothetical protein